VCRQDGAAAVEFALVAFPFFGFLFAILQTALVFFAGQTLQAAAADAGRLIMTGQAQNASYSAGQFATAVCARTFGLFDCANRMTVDVKKYSDFGTAAAGESGSVLKNGQIDTTKTGFTMGGPGCIQVVTVYYQWPIVVPMLNLSNMNGNSRLLQATSVFKNEPYSTSGACS
jgi:Flp pilus assembly protein TadG